LSGVSVADTYGQAALRDADRDRLVVDYLPLVKHVVARLPVSLPPTLDREDLYGAGVLGLMHAAKTFNPARGASFKTHAFGNVRGAILDEIRKHDIVPRSRRDRLRKFEEVSSRLAAELGREALPEELAQAMDLDLEQIDEILLHHHTVKVLSLDEPAHGSEGRDAAADIRSRSEGDDPAAAAERQELKERLKGAIRDLAENERSVILLYYAESLLLKEIGAVLGITESRVCQIHARAIRKLNASILAPATRRTKES
jgi:RNA polymerase sigma factor for flagellar operon FliA